MFRRCGRGQSVTVGNSAAVASLILGPLRWRRGSYVKVGSLKGQETRVFIHRLFSTVGENNC